MQVFNKLDIAIKLPILIIALGLISSISTGTIALIRANNLAIVGAKEKLESLEASRNKTLEIYLSSIKQDLSSLAYSDEVQEAVHDFKKGWQALTSGQTQKLQKLYINDNPHPTGAKEELDFADDGSSYSLSHKKYHPWFRHVLRQKSYYDIFIFSTDGNLVYTVFKELDYATNLNSGKWKDTDLGHSFRAALKSKSKDEQFFYDFKPYGPSFDAPASFISQAIYDDAKNIIGVLVFQMPINRINEVMQVSAGLGESGETYIVGQDQYMRSDSRFSEESTILKTKVTGETVDLVVSQSLT